MEILEKLFGNIGKVKIMKLFIFNPSSYFHVEDVVRKTKVKKNEVRKTLALFENTEFIRKRDVKNSKGKKVRAWHLNATFPYLNAFKDFFLEVLPFTNADLVQKLSRTGRLKVVAISGIFLQSDEAGVDLLIAGDRLNKSSLNRVIKEIESGLGKEIKYAVLDTADFTYRLSSRDKLIRDVFDYPHNLILDKVGVQV